MRRRKYHPESVTRHAFLAARGAAICLICLICPLLLAGFAGPAPAFGAEPEKWPGVDETVVEKIAKEHGRAAVTPLINTDQGDLPLFVFLLAGAVGGFAAGYFWRKLTEPGRAEAHEGKQHEPI
jgi:cobalt/nickel transport system permease protein